MDSEELTPSPLQTLESLPAKPPAFKKWGLVLAVGGMGLGALILVVFLSPGKKKLGLNIPPAEESPPPAVSSPFAGQPEATQAAIRRKIDFPYIGETPFFPSNLRVYRVREKVKDLLSREESSQLASLFSFLDSPVVVDDGEGGEAYQWSTRYTGKFLTVNPRKQEIYYVQEPADLKPVSQSKGDYEAAAVRFLKSKGLLSEYLATVPEKTGYLKFLNPGWKGLDSASSAQAVQVFFDYQLGGATLAGHYFGKEPVRVIMDADLNVIDFKYTPFDRSRLTFLAEYPAKTFESALEEVQQGGYFLVYQKETLLGKMEVLILMDKLQQGRLVDSYLAYFMPSGEMDLLQPVYVFEGEGEVDGKTVEFEVYLQSIEY